MSQSTVDWSEARKELTKPLDSSNVKPAKSFGPKGDYIEGWHAMNEANRIFGFGGWSYSIVQCDCVAAYPREIGQGKKPGHGVSYVARILVDVGGVSREDVGAGHGYDVDLGLAHESAIKEAVTDALKRALRSFGNPFGLALYDKSRANVTDGTPEKTVEKPKPTPDASALRDGLKTALTGAKDADGYTTITTSDKFKGALQWLCDNDKPKHLEVVAAMNAREKLVLDGGVTEFDKETGEVK